MLVHGLLIATDGPKPWSLCGPRLLIRPLVVVVLVVLSTSTRMAARAQASGRSDLRFVQERHRLLRREDEEGEASLLRTKEIESNCLDAAGRVSPRHPKLLRTCIVLCFPYRSSLSFLMPYFSWFVHSSNTGYRNRKLQAIYLITVLGTLPRFLQLLK